MNPIGQLLRELLRQLLDGTGAEVEVKIHVTVRAAKRHAKTRH